MTRSRFNDVRYLGGSPELTRFVRGALHVSDEGVTLWTTTIGGGRLLMPAGAVRSCEVLSAEEAERELGDLTVDAKPGGGVFVVIRSDTSERIVLEIVTDLGVEVVREQLAPYLPVATERAEPPRPKRDTGSTGASSEMAKYDLAQTTHDDRAVITSTLVAHAVPHRWDGATLVVPAQNRSAVDKVLRDKTRRVSDRASGSATPKRTRHKSGHLAEQVAVLERLVALRDAGALTETEFETARARAVRDIVGET